MRSPGPVLQGTAPSEPDKTALEIPECYPESERRSMFERKRYFLSLTVKHH